VNQREGPASLQKAMISEGRVGTVASPLSAWCLIDMISCRDIVSRVAAARLRWISGLSWLHSSRRASMQRDRKSRRVAGMRHASA